MYARQARIIANDVNESGGYVAEVLAAIKKSAEAGNYRLTWVKGSKVDRHRLKDVLMARGFRSRYLDVAEETMLIQWGEDV